MKNKSKSIALGGLMTALSVILLYLASILPTGTLVLVSIASLPVAIMIMEENYKYGLLTYATTGLVFFLVSGNLKGLVTYLIFFGIYPIIKHIAERLPFIIKEFALKLGFFNLSLLILVLAFKVLGVDFLMLVKEMNLPFGISNASSGIAYWILPYILFAIAQAAFIAYDYGFSILIGFYIKRVSLKG